MPPRRRRRRNGRALPPIVAIVIGLAVAATFYWYRNPDVELSLPWGITDRVAQQPSRERAPESFAAITATRIPEPTARPAESDGSRQLRRLIPPVGNGTREERQARAELEAVAKAADIELKVHAGINAERARNGVDPQLSWDDQLGAVARAHSEDMTGRGYFSHDTPEGMGPSDRIDRAGYSCWKGSHYGVAENIAIEIASGDLDEVAAEAVQSWMDSPGHRTNLLGRQYDRTGIGVSFGKWKGYDAVYLTQVFC